MPVRSDERQNTNTAVTRMHRRMVVLDNRFANERTQEVHKRLLKAQRDYYRELLHYYRAIHRDRPYNIAPSFMSALVRRAQQTRKQWPEDPAWQAMAQHQYQRAWKMHQRAKALRDLEDPPQPKPERQRKPKPTHMRVRHHITRRWIWVPITPEEAAVL